MCSGKIVYGIYIVSQILLNYVTTYQGMGGGSGSADPSARASEAP